MSRELTRFINYYLIFVVSTIFLVYNIPYVKYVLPILVWFSLIFRMISVVISNDIFMEMIDKLKLSIRIESIWLYKISALFMVLSYSVVLYQQQYYITLAFYLSSYYLLTSRVRKNWIEYRNA